MRWVARKKRTKGPKAKHLGFPILMGWAEAEEPTKQYCERQERVERVRSQKPYQRLCSKELDVVNSVGCCGVVKLDKNCIVNWIWMGGDQ